MRFMVLEPLYSDQLMTDIATSTEFLNVSPASPVLALACLPLGFFGPRIRSNFGIPSVFSLLVYLKMSILGTESPYSSLEDLYSYLWNTEVPEKHHFEKYLFKDLP